MALSLTTTLAKVPEATLVFWCIKVLATTLGETGGDSLSMSMQLGYLTSSGIFLLLFLLAVGCQLRARRFRPWLYWITIIATTTLGTTLADFADRSLGIGYAGGTALIALLLITTLLIWQRTLGSISIHSVNAAAPEAFYWVTILFSQTLGTALGDWTADSLGMGYLASAFLFGALLALIALAHYRTRLSSTLLFWAAFVLTRPLGAVVGDLLDKPLAQGGLELSRYGASLVLLAAIVTCVLLLPQRAASQAH